MERRGVSLEAVELRIFIASLAEYQLGKTCSPKRRGHQIVYMTVTWRKGWRSCRTQLPTDLLN
jgi:hypothetical protein